MRKIIPLILIAVFYCGLSFSQTIQEIEHWSESWQDSIKATDVVDFIDATQSSSGINYGEPYIFHEEATSYNSSASLSEDIFVIAYVVASNLPLGGEGEVVLGRIVNDSIIFSSAQVFHPGYTGHFSCTGMDENRFVISWCDGAMVGFGDHRIKSRVGEVIGDSIALGPIAEYGYSNNWISTAKLDSTRFVLAAQISANGKVIVGELNDNTISFGMTTIFNPGFDAHHYFVAALSPSCIAIVYTEGSYFHSPDKAIIGNISNGTITFGNEYLFTTANAAYFRIANLDTNSFVITYPGYDGMDLGTAVVGIVYGDSISFGDSYVFSQVTNYFHHPLRLDASRFLVASCNFYDSTLYGTTHIGSVFGDSISYSPAYEYTDAFTGSVSSALLDENKFMIAFRAMDTVAGQAVIGTYYDGIETFIDSMDICSGDMAVAVQTKNLYDAVESYLQLSYDTLLLSYTGYQNFSDSIPYDSLSITQMDGSINIYWHAQANVNLASDTLVELLFESIDIYSPTSSVFIFNDTMSYYKDSTGLLLSADYYDGQINIDPIPEPAVFIAGTDSLCQGTTNVVYGISTVSNATSYGWSLMPDSAGLIIGGDTIISIDFSADFYGTVSLWAHGLNDCGSGDTAIYTIEVIGFPQANAGPDVSICENTSHTLNGSALNYSTTVWTSEGDGTFDDPFILNATYTPGPADIENGSVQLKLYAMAISPCIFAEVDEMMIFIGSLPSQPPMPSGPTFITPDTTHSSEYYISTSTNSNLYQWELNPPEAGTISSMDTLAEVNWNENFQGILAYIHVEAINNCGGRLSDTLIVNISPVGLLDMQVSETQIFIHPNPSGGIFNISIQTPINQFDLTVANTNSHIILQKKIRFSGSENSLKLDLSDQTPGIYYLQISDGNSIFTKKLVLN